MSAPLVSVVMPCHNAASFVGAAIDSVRAQSMRDWELLVVDDASTDGSGGIVAQRAARDRRIIPVTLARQSGVSHARNIAIGRAAGRYIAFLDSDDLWLPNKLAQQTAFMAAHDLAFSYASYRLLDARGGHLGMVSAPPSITYRGMLKTCAVGCLTAIYDTRQLGKMYLPAVGRGDYGLWLNILKRSASAQGISAPLAVYRVGKASYSSNKLRAARKQWQTYTQGERLGNARALYYFAHYACYGLTKYIRSRLRTGDHSPPPPPPPPRFITPAPRLRVVMPVSAQLPA